jgi:hypothetical protein
VAILEAVLFGFCSNIAALFYVYKKLSSKIEDFIEAVESLDLSGGVELNADAMEMQMQAAKQAQIFDFLRSVVQPNIQVSEIQQKDASGKFV